MRGNVHVNYRGPLAIILAAIMGLTSVQAQQVTTPKTITLGQSISQVQQKKMQAQAPTRQRAWVQVHGLYGHTTDLRASITVNGHTAHQVAVGDILAAGRTRCQVTAIDHETMRVSLKTTGASGDRCPAHAEYSMAAPTHDGSATQQHPLNALSSTPGTRLTLPPLPVPALQVGSQ